jgi:hypothetical protein
MPQLDSLTRSICFPHCGSSGSGVYYTRSPFPGCQPATALMFVSNVMFSPLPRVQYCFLSFCSTRANIFIGLLCVNLSSTTQRIAFGKGTTPGRYRLTGHDILSFGGSRAAVGEQGVMKTTKSSVFHFLRLKVTSPYEDRQYVTTSRPAGAESEC